jgi:hypothetical protein
MRRRIVRWFLLALLGLSLRASAQQRTVSITVDDLPYVSHTHTALTLTDVNHARQVNRKLLVAFKKYGVPVTGFVNEGRVEGLGLKDGYKLATCTIDDSDYLFNDAYVSILAQKDEKTAKKLRLEFLAYTSSEIDYYASLNKQVLGYEPPQVMVVHDNRLNADVINGLLELFVRKNYKFVSLATAQSDAAFITQYGWMWGYRWAKELNVQVNGRLEPEPPQWVVLRSGGSK